MILAAVAVAGAVALVPIASAQAAPQKLGRTVLVGGNPQHRLMYQRWIDGAFPRVKQAKAIVVLKELNCPGSGPLTACVVQSGYPGAKLKLYVPAQLLDPKNFDPIDMQNTVLHEVGHVFDFSFNRDRHRGTWLKIFGIPGPFYTNQKDPPYERFAVGYSYCAQGFTYAVALTRLPYDVYEYKFTRDQYDAVCAMLRPLPSAPAKPVVPKR